MYGARKNFLKASDFLLLLSLSVAGFVMAAIGLSDDVFLDGVVYASISRNMAEGRGGFWTAYYSGGPHPFSDHPPLAFWLQSLAFTIFGDTRAIDYWWGGMLFAVSLFLMLKVWTKAHLVYGGSRGSEQAKSLGWLVMALYAASYLGIWCAANNMIENTLLVFVLLAAYFFLLAREYLGAMKGVIYAGMGGCVCAGSLLIKGPASLFLFALPPVIYILSAKTSRPATALQLAAASIAAAALGLLVYVAGGDDLQRFFHNYYHGQLMASLAGHKEVAPDSFYLLRALIKYLSLPLLATLLITEYQKYRGQDAVDAGSKRAALFFLVVGICASAPFFFVRKQMEWYLAPSLPFFIMSLASFGGNFAMMLCAKVEKAKTAVLVMSVIMIFAALGLWTRRGMFHVEPSIKIRDFLDGSKEKRAFNSEYTWDYFYHDVVEQGIELPKHSIVSSCPEELHDKWRIRAYLQRIYQADLTAPSRQRYLIVSNGGAKCIVPDECKAMQKSPPKMYTVYRCY